MMLAEEGKFMGFRLSQLGSSPASPRKAVGAGHTGQAFAGRYE